MKRAFQHQRNPYDGPRFGDAWFSTVPRGPRRKWNAFVEYCRKRHQIFGGSLQMLEEALSDLLKARPWVRTGGRRELEYLINKTEAYMLLFELLRLLEEGYISYDEAFQIKAQNQEQVFRDKLVSCEALFQAAHRKARELAEKEA